MNFSYKTLLLLIFPSIVYAGNQKYEKMKEETVLLMKQNVSDSSPKISSFATKEEEDRWVNKNSAKIANIIVDSNYRNELLRSIHYEATRAGLEPELILGLIYIESRFNKYSISNQNARGLMQIMPFWVDIIGENSHNVFNIRTNLRYGCTILRHYTEIENGNIIKALARYNGSIGKTDYPNKVISKTEYFKR